MQAKHSFCVSLKTRRVDIVPLSWTGLFAACWMERWSTRQAWGRKLTCWIRSWWSWRRGRRPESRRWRGEKPKQELQPQTVIVMAKADPFVLNQFDWWSIASCFVFVPDFALVEILKLAFIEPFYKILNIDLFHFKKIVRGISALWEISGLVFRTVCFALGENQNQDYLYCHCFTESYN